MVGIAEGGNSFRMATLSIDGFIYTGTAQDPFVASAHSEVPGAILTFADPSPDVKFFQPGDEVQTNLPTTSDGVPILLVKYDTFGATG